MSLLKQYVLPLAVATMLAAQSVPNFAPPVTYLTDTSNSLSLPTANWSVAIDLNGDGLIDLAAPDGRANGNNLGFTVLLANPGGGYAPPVFRTTGFLVTGLNTADFNRDGRPDLLLVSSEATAVLLGDGAGGFGAPIRVSIPVVPLAGANGTTGDFNGDGIPDILIPGDTGYAVALGTGTGTFQAATLYPQAFGSPYVVTSDFNNDGKLDFAGTRNSQNPGAIYLGNGDGTFQTPLSSFVIPVGTIAADFDKDGIPDLAMVNASARQDGSDWTINILRGLGDGQFVSYSSYRPGVTMLGLAAADFDGDGALDVLTTIGSTATARKVLILYGGGRQSEIPMTGSGNLFVADLDGNGSKDLVWSEWRQFTVYANTHGNPPLLAQIGVNPASVIGGAAYSTGTVQLGSAAPAGGAVIALATTDSAAAFFPAGPKVTIPAGLSSATFQIATTQVSVSTPINISGTWNGLTQVARLDLVPAYVLNGLSINPASQYGIFSVIGTVTLSNPADTEATVGLVTSNPALATVPPSVTVPAGNTSVNFTISLKPVVANTAIGISAVRGGVTQTSTFTILPPADSVAISKAILTAKTAELKVEATSTSTTTTITVHNAATGTMLGKLANAGGGKYSGTVFVPAGLTNITLNSALGGTITGSVSVK
jgi:hypothetical protein